jgi:hypothetical protein
MKDTRLNHGILGALLLMASVANAQDYPAADFQPKVLFRDESIAASSAATTASAPCVTQDQASTGKQDSVAVVDPQYPASNFQPKVIFTQAN